MNGWPTYKARTWKSLDEKSKSLLIVVALVFISIVPYVMTLGNPFIWDSVDRIQNNEVIHSFESIPRLFMEPTNPQGGLPYYRPLHYVFYVFEYSVFGDTPLGYRIIALLLHALTTVLLYRIMLVWRGNMRLAMYAAMIFAVIPGRAEAIYWVYGASNILLAVFILLSLLSYMRERHVLATVCFTLALLSRESAVLFPVILLLYELNESRHARRKIAMRVLPFVVLTVMFVLVRSVILGATPPISNLPFVQIIYSIAVIVSTYLKITLVPDGMVVHYPFVEHVELSQEVTIGLLVLALCLVAGIALYKKERFLFFWYAWFFVWIAVWFNVGRFGYFILTEKELYLAAAGIAVMLAQVISMQKYRIFIVTVLLLYSAGTIFVRAAYWKDPVTYFSESIKSSQPAFFLYGQLGHTYMMNGEYARAISVYEKGLHLTDSKSKFRNDLGNAYLALKDTAKAKMYWYIAYKQDERNYVAPKNLGTLAYHEGNVKGAIYYYSKHIARAKYPDTNVVRRMNILRAMSGAEK